VSEGGDGREDAIRELFPLVRSVARRLARLLPAADTDDLIGDGSIGLIRAVDTFDPARGTKLEAYAKRLILGQMLNGLRGLDHVSERVRRTLREAERRRFALAQELGTLPPFIDLEREQPALRAARRKAFVQTPLSLDAPLPAGNHAPADVGADPLLHVQRRAAESEIRDALAALPPRQRHILELHYYGELSLHAIGARLRVSPQRISQIHIEALQRLRGVLPPA